MNFFRLMPAAFLAMAALACSTGDDTDVTGEGPLAPYTLSADKSEIESDGRDRAVFTITDANGMVLTGKNDIRKTSFHIVETDEWKSGMILDEPNVLTSISDGTYTVEAMYDGVQCENAVEVVSMNRDKYEVFHKNVAIYRFTATWCRYCPDMTDALSQIGNYTKDHSVVMEFHVNDEFSIPALSDYLDRISGVPYCIYSLDYSAAGASSVKEIRSYVKQQLVEYPAMTGIKASSSVSGNKMTVEATVKASKAGQFDLGMAIIKDRCVPASMDAYESVYNDVVFSISGNFNAMSSDGTFSLDAGAEKKIVKEWTSDILTSEDLKDCSVVLFTLTSYNRKVVIDNVIELKVGESVPDYRYN